MRQSGKEIPMMDPESDAEEGQTHHSDESQTSRWDLAIEAMLAPLLLFMPLALGTVQPWSELVAFAVITAMSLCLVGKLVFERGARFLWSWAYLPIALFIAIVGLQLLPLPPALINAISPNTLKLKMELLAGIKDSATVLFPTTLTFYRPATLHDLRIVLAAAALMVVVANTFRTPRQIRRLLMTVIACGGIVGFVALVQDLCELKSIYGLFPISSAGNATGGPFVNRSHFAQFMNLSIGFALGLLLVRLHELFPGKDISPARLATPWRDSGVWSVWLAVAVILIGALAVCLCMSRSGLVSMIAAGTAVGVAIAFSRNSSGRGSFLTLLALIVFASVLYLGFDAISARFTTAHDVGTGGGRLQIIKDLKPVFHKFPILGTGLGTHKTVFPMFDTTVNPTEPQYVEVELAQMMEEMGAVGVLLVLAFIVMIARAFARGVRRKHPIHGAALGMAFGLGAVILHSFTDFGQHFMADASLSAISCGLILALSRSMRPVPAESTGSESARQAKSLFEQRWFRRRAGMVACIVVAGLMLLLMPDAISAQRAAIHAGRADGAALWLASKDWLGDDDDFIYLLTEAGLASTIRPADVTYHQFLNEYRWHSLCRTRDPQTKQPVFTAEDLGFARRVADELLKGRLLCPTYGPAPALAGQIEYFYLNDPAGVEHIRLGASLSPHDSLTCFIAGELDANQGNVKGALELLDRAITVDPQLGDAAIRVCLDEAHNPDLAVQLAWDKPEGLIRVADSLDQRKISPDISSKCRDRAFTLLSASVLQSDPPAADLAMLGGLDFSRGNFPAAVDCFSHAIEIDYAQPMWHLKLAQALEAIGKRAEAYREGLVCLRLQHGVPEADQLLDRTRDFAGTQPADQMPATGP